MEIMATATDLLQKVVLGAKSLESSIIQNVGSASQFVRKNPITSSVSVAGGVLAGGTIIQIARKRRKKASVSKKKKSRSRKKKPTTRRKVSKKRGGRVHKHKGKHRGTKQIHMTKKGQPYIILASGKARFIKKSSASRMKKLKGGRY